MLYHITRGGQTYGPYTLADLRRYVDSGHVQADDLAKSEEMADWLPVSQILNPSGAPPNPVAPVTEPPYAGPYPPQPVFPAGLYADPPNLHWGLVLLFDVITAKLFQMVWNLILSAWMKRVQPNSKALFYYSAGYLLGLLYTILYLPALIQQMQHMMNNEPALHVHYAHSGLASLLGLAAWVFKLLARFDMKRSLEEHFNTIEPIGFSMSGVATFFFGGLYIQAQLNRINEIKRGIRYSQYGR